MPGGNGKADGPSQGASGVGNAGIRKGTSVGSPKRCRTHGFAQGQCESHQCRIGDIVPWKFQRSGGRGDVQLGPASSPACSREDPRTRVLRFQPEGLDVHSIPRPDESPERQGIPSRLDVSLDPRGFALRGVHRPIRLSQRGACPLRPHSSAYGQERRLRAGDESHAAFRRIQAQGMSQIQSAARFHGSSGRIRGKNLSGAQPQRIGPESLPPRGALATAKSGNAQGKKKDPRPRGRRSEAHAGEARQLRVPRCAEAGDPQPWRRRWAFRSDCRAWSAPRRTSRRMGRRWKMWGPSMRSRP